MPSKRTKKREVAARTTIVALGASAGGLEAIERFLAHVPPDAGLAIVVIQHLDPTHKGLLAGILQAESPLPVVEVTDAMPLEAGRVHVIPPNREMVVTHGLLHLREPSGRRGTRLPIDVFFRSLAAEQTTHAIGVILSGMGTDGTDGAREVREKGGAIFVQSPTEAKFSGMPESAIAAGVADAIASVDDLPRLVLARVDHPEPRDALTEGPSPAELEQIIEILHRTTGNDFSLYKRSTLQRRVQRRMAVHQLGSPREYVAHLGQNAHEAELLYNELLIGVTSFFRDPPVWESMKKDVFPALLEQRERGSILRAWIPACSTGEEAYSLGIIFREAVEARRIDDIGLQIFATDLDESAIEKARAAQFPAAIEADVSPERLTRFFVKEKRGGYRLRKEVRDLVIFAKQNVIDDPPFTRLDFLSCRNLLIYLASELQRRLIPLFHYSLKPGGVLLLGSAETVGTFTDLFMPVNGEQRFYRRAHSVSFPVTSALAARYPQGAMSAPAVVAKTPPARATAPSSIEQFLLQRFAPASVVASERGDIVFVSGRTGRYLELPAGKANWNLFAMARAGLRQSLVAAFQRARRTMSAVVLGDLRVDTGQGKQLVNVTVEPIDEAGLRGTMIVLFEEHPSTLPSRTSKKTRANASARADSVERLTVELRELRHELDALRENMQSSEEELTSANEELQSTIEELQSSNEELTTSKEETQSINEELRTLNSELQAKVDELSRASSDMKNLLDSTEIAVLFLDSALNIRRYTPQMTTLMKLIPGDVGRPLADLASDFDYAAIHADANEVLRTLVSTERRIERRSSQLVTVRIMPYRTSENRVDGVVITFTNFIAS